MFSAVENEQLERARMIIESTDVNVNSCNSDGFSPLDIAVMTLNMPLIKLLQSYGSKESCNCELSFYYLLHSM
jgi:ankyrin repeat protein